MAGGDTGNGNKPPDADAPPVTQSIRVVRKASKPTGIRQVGKATKATPASGPADPPTVSFPVVLPLKEHARVWMALAGMLGILLIAALVIVGYLWNVNGKWQAQVEALTATGYDLGDRIADHQAQIEQLRSANDRSGGSRDRRVHDCGAPPLLRLPAAGNRRGRGGCTNRR